MAKFETKVVLMRMYGDIEIEVVCELERDGYFYKFPMGLLKILYLILAMNIR